MWQNTQNWIKQRVFKADFVISVPYVIFMLFFFYFLFISYKFIQITFKTTPQVTAFTACMFYWFRKRAKQKKATLLRSMFDDGIAHTHSHICHIGRFCRIYYMILSCFDICDGIIKKCIDKQNGIHTEQFQPNPNIDDEWTVCFYSFRSLPSFYRIDHFDLGSNELR